MSARWARDTPVSEHKGRLGRESFLRKEPASPFRLRIHACNLIRRQDFDFRLPLVKFNCVGDADGFPLDPGKSLIGSYRRPGRDKPGERLIGVVSSEIDKCGTQRAGCYRDNPPAHLDLFADIFNGFRVFYHYRLARTRRNRTEKQSENCVEKADPHCEMRIS